MSAPSQRTRLERIAADCTAASLRRAARAVSNLYDERMAPSGLRGTQFSLLVAVALTDEAPLSRLAELLGLDRTTLTRNLGPLIRDGLLASKPASDRRVSLVRLTSKGRAALERAIPLWEAAQRHVVERLGQSGWEKLVAGLKDTATLASR